MKNKPKLYELIFAGTGLLSFLLVAVFSYSNYPCLDDFGFVNIRELYGFFGFQSYYYNQWTGRFAGVFAHSLTHPLFYRSYLLYKVFPIIIESILILTIYLSVRKFKLNRNPYQLSFIVLGFFAVVVSSIPSVVDAFYWVPSTWYTTSIAINILQILAVSAYLQNPKIRNLFIALILSVFCTGLLELNIVITLFVLGVALLDKFLKVKAVDFKLAAVLVISIITSMISITAPGNFHRSAVIAEIQGTSNTVHDLGFTIGQSFRYFFTDFVDYFILSPFLVFAIFLFLFGSKLRINWKLNVHPALLGLGCFLVVLSQYVVFFYASGLDTAMPERTTNGHILFSFLSILFLINYTQAWYQKYPEVKTSVLSITAGLFLVSFFLSNNVSSGLKSVRARDFIAYHNEMESRLDLVRNSPNQALVVDSLQFYPKWVFYSDFSANDTTEHNMMFSKYWGIKSIRLKAPGETLQENQP
jgi:hypothetical protein